MRPDGRSSSPPSGVIENGRHSHVKCLETSGSSVCFWGMHPFLSPTSPIRRLLPAPTRSTCLFGPCGTGRSTYAQQCLPDAVVIDLRTGPVARALAAEPERLHARLDATAPVRGKFSTTNASVRITARPRCRRQGAPVDSRGGANRCGRRAATTDRARRDPPGRARARE
jgi:hypothetical protein